MLGARGILTLLVLAALLGGAAVAVLVPVLYPSLADPAVANRDELLRWLVTRDLNEEPATTRQTLARRLEEEFGGEVDWEGLARQLDESQRRRLWDNVLVLLEPWFMDKTDRYFRLAAADRPAYLDRLIDTISAWRGVEALRPASADHAGRSGAQRGLLEALFGQVEEWKKRADPKRREQISQFLLAVTTRSWTRSLQGLTPPPPD
jgi:hypothetical protein